MMTRGTPMTQEISGNHHVIWLLLDPNGGLLMAEDQRIMDAWCQLGAQGVCWQSSPWIGGVHLVSFRHPVE